jgi:hypothetical protein
VVEESGVLLSIDEQETKRQEMEEVESYEVYSEIKELIVEVL